MHEKLNLKDREENTPLICNGYYKLPGGDRVLHAMHTESSVHKGICMILTQRGLWVLGMKKQQDLQVIFRQVNSKPEKFSSVLDKMVKCLGFWLDFVTKYHTDRVKDSYEEQEF